MFQFQQMKRFYIGVLSNFGVCPELLTQVNLTEIA